LTAGFATYERQAADIRRQLRILRQTHEAAAAPARSPIELAADLGIALDPWQRNALSAHERNILLLASRQAGKSTVSYVASIADSGRLLQRPERACFRSSSAMAARSTHSPAKRAPSAASPKSTSWSSMKLLVFPTTSIPLCVRCWRSPVAG
jgi:hypothetical protein